MLSKRLINQVLRRKAFAVSVCQSRRHEGLQVYQPSRKGGFKYEQPLEEEMAKKSEWDKLSGGFRVLVRECKLWMRELYNEVDIMSSYDTFTNKEVVKLWDFNQRNNGIISSYHSRNGDLNDLPKWQTSCDSSFGEGYTTCEWKVSPTGRGLFTGYLDTRVPADGLQKRSGFAFLGCEKARKSFYRQDFFDWAEFTHLLVRCRGDGRNYRIILNVSDDRMDITWFDRYQYVLYTHGGPYWQWSKIPFSRFFWQFKAYAQDTQPPLPKDFICQIGFLLADDQSGPFNLEIDYVGAMRDDDHDEETVYEQYFHKEVQWKDPGSS